MNVVFRVDASSQIGTGHLMRCLTLADALKQSGARTRFISRHLPECLRSMLAVHECVLLDGVQYPAEIDELAHAHWLGVSQMRDATETLRSISDESWDWLVVDHYALDARWEYTLRQKVRKILVIDDLADRNHYSDVLLDQNLCSDMNNRYTKKIPTHCKLLLGPHYALLRDEFRQMHKQTKLRSGSIKRVLVFFGGVDADNCTGIAIEVLAKAAMPGMQVDVVIGAQHPCLDQIKVACARYEFYCYVQTDKMAELMATADLAIGAAGSASWERCCLGLPTLLVALADNQIRIAEGLDVIGAGIYVGTLNKAITPNMLSAMLSLLHSPDQFTSLSEKAYSLVDGLGAGRVLQEMRG